jgi:2-succinyl-6-hydroxy-2,4-cyclohexadiene-1-carboxylate synthase
VSLNVLTLGEGSPMLLLHGFTGSARSWATQVETWSQHHRVIAPDLLGHGGSDAPRDPGRYALPRQATDLAELLRLMDAAPAAVVGYSMGARLALVLTLEYPELVDRLILESPSAGISEATTRAERRVADERLAADLERDGLTAFVERWQQMPLFASHAGLTVEARGQLRSERLSHDAVGLAASLRGAGQGAMAPLHDRLGGISTPTLVVAGELDGAGRDRALAVADGIPGARLEIIPGAGHTPHLERAHDFTLSTAGFLSAAPITPTQ